jgi:hypothetical protein
MCAVKREISADFDELRYLEIRCKCGTSVFIDVARETMTPTGCPGCNSRYGETFEATLGLFKRVYRGFVNVNADSAAPTVWFRLPLEQEPLPAKTTLPPA